MEKSLGLIEVYGLVPAILIADAMAKVASVQLLPIDSTIGAGYVQIRVTGDVAAVQAAVETGEALARKHECHIAHSVLARAAEPVHASLRPDKQPEANNAEERDVSEAEAPPDTIDAQGPEISALQPDIQSEENAAIPVNSGATCNICNDPACSRLKG
ncbi:BMC domain-containing protein [Shigella flexneri]|nr:BMC domain-containing protein [Escherichia coli]